MRQAQDGTRNPLRIRCWRPPGRQLSERVSRFIMVFKLGYSMEEMDDRYEAVASGLAGRDVDRWINDGLSESGNGPERCDAGDGE